MTNVFCINTNLPSVEKLVKEVKSNLDNLLNEKQIALLWNKWVELDNSNIDKLPTSEDIKATYGKLANMEIEDFRNSETLSEKSEILDVIQYMYFFLNQKISGKLTFSREDTIKNSKEVFERIQKGLKKQGLEFVANDFENYKKYFEATRLNKFQIPDVDLEVQEGKQKDTIGENSSIYTDNKENCSDEVVYLIASLTTDEKVFGLPKPVNFDQTWNIIQNLLGNSIGDLEFQVDVLQQSNEPFIPQLLQKLGVIDGQISPETKDNTNVRTSFTEAFAKQQQDISITPVGLKNSFSAINGQEKTSFRDNAKSLFRASKFAHKINGKTVLNKEEYNKIKFNNTPESLKEFLALFGIDIQGEMTKDIINNAIVIKDFTNKYLINNELEWLDFQDKALNVSSRVMSIIETQLPYVKKNKNLSVKNAEGKKQSAQSNHNYFSKLFSKLLNKIIKPKSALEKLISNGEVELNLVSGAQTQDRSEAFVFNKLSFTDIVTTTITNMFSNTPIIQLPRTSDKSSERSMKMLFTDKNANMAYTDISNIILKNLYDAFQSDLNQTFSNKWKYGAKDSFAFWKELGLEEIKDPSGEKYFETFKTKILEYVQSQQKETIDLFQELGVINLAKKQINFTDSAWNKMSGTFEEKLAKTVDNFNFNSLYFGVLYTQMTQGSMSPTTIENMYKRFAGPVAEARTTRADAFKVNYLNEGFRKLGLDKFNAKYLKVYVHAETEQASEDQNLIAEIYKKNNVDDAQGIMLLPMYKVTLEMTNQWLPKQEELYQKIMKREKVNEKEFKSTFPPIKPVGQCVIEIDGAKVPVYIKTAVYPISPLDVQGLENEDKYNHGIANGIGLYIPKSGIKMTTPKKLNPIYNKEGKIDEENTTFNFPMEYFGIQLDINPKTSTKQLIGTQIRKLLTTNLFKQGKAADPKYKEWVDKNIKLYEDLSKIETDKLYEAAGIELIKGEPKIINFNKLKELVTDELLSRNMPINVINSLKYIIDTNGNLNGNTIDSLPARQKIMNLLNAIVTNRLIKLNTNGTALVQISQQGWKLQKIDKNVEFFKGFWNRTEVAQQTNKVFLFGDNTDDRLNTKYIPSSTQAVIRGLDNAIGIDTKKNRGTGKDSYFTDSDFDVFKKQVDQAINQAKKTGKIIVIPADGIGTGKAMLAEKAPKLFEYLQNELNNLSKVNDSDIIAMKTAIDFVSNDAKLNYYKKGGLQFFTKGNRTGEAEILIPAKYKHYVKPDGTFDESLLVNIGYRIPTQGHNSMLHLKVVGYLPAHLDQVVVMPKEITSQGGSDFDVDKINLFIPNSIILDGKTKFISMDMNPVEIFNNKKAGFEKLITYFNNKIEQYYRKLDKADKKGEDYVSDEVLELLTNNPELYADLEELEIKNIFDSKDFTVEDYEKIYKKLEKLRTKEGKEEWIQNFKSKQLQNEIITQTVEILEDPIVYAALTNPNNSDDLKADAERVNKNLGSKAKKIKLTYNNLFKGITLLKTTYQMFAAKALVGVFASQSTHHALAQQVGLHFKSGRKFFFDHNTVEVDGELRISLSNDKSQEYVDLVESEKQGKIVMKRYEISDALGNNKLTAAVDAAKDDYLTSLGINLQTGDVFALGDRVGANPYYMTAWINQPIIQDYLNLTKKANSMTAKSGGNDMNKKKIIRTVIDNAGFQGMINGDYYPLYLVEKYEKNDEAQYIIDIKESRNKAGNYTVEQLEDSWFNNKGTKEMALHLLDDFLYFEDAAAILRQSISTSKFDTAGPGKDVLESLLLSMKYQKFVEDMNDEDGYTLATIEDDKQAPYANIIDKTLLKVFYDKSFNFVGSIYHDLVALHKNTYIEDAVKGLIYPTAMNFVTKPADSQEASKIYGAVINYLIQSQIPLNHSLVYGDNTVHHRIIEIQENPNHPLHNNDVIQSFFNVELSGNDGIPSVSAPKSKSITTDEAGAFTRAFEEIQFLEPELYNDLVTIAMYQTGVLQSPTSFYNYLPVQTVIPLVSKAIKDAIPTNSKKIARAVIANIGNKMDNIQRVTAKEGDSLEDGRLILIDPEKAKGKVFIKYTQYIGNESITKLYENVGPYFQEIKPKNHKQLFYDLRDNAEPIEAVGVIDEEIPSDVENPFIENEETENEETEQPINKEIKANEVKVISDPYGVVTTETNPSELKTAQFVNIIQPQIKKQAYKENNSSTANDMFMYGLRWTRKNKAKAPINNKSYANGGKETTNPLSKDSYVYDTLDQNGKPLAPLTELQPIISEIEKSLGIDMTDYDAVIGNIYLPGQNIATHRDTTESLSARNYPVIVYTIGNDSGISVYENEKNPGSASFASDKKITIPTKNGTIYTFGMDGKGRFEVAHDTPKGIKRDKSFPKIMLPNGDIIENYTITLTFRRAADLEPNMPTTPKKIVPENIEIENNSKLEDKELLIIEENEIPKKDGESFSEMQKRVTQNINIRKRIEIANKNNIIQGKSYSYSEIKKLFNNDKLFDNEIYKQLDNILQSSNLVFKFGSLNQGKKTTNAYYNSISNSINIDTLVLQTLNLATSDFKRILLHEIIHAATFINLKENAILTSTQKTALNNLNNLIVELNKDRDFFAQYGLTNANELLAELANKGFVDKLKNKKFNNNQSFFDKIISEIVKLLGLKTTAYDIVKESFDNLIKEKLQNTTIQTAWDNLTLEQQEQLKDKVLPEYFNTWSKEKQEAFLECNTK
jgi:hypothetical protein